MGKTRTIAIYDSDCKELEKMMSYRQTFKEKIHELVLEEVKRMKGGK